MTFDCFIHSRLSLKSGGKTMRNKKGFTLAELMVVVAIIGVLVAVSVPIFNSQLEKSREATDLANVRSAYAQVMTEAISKDGLPEPVAVFLKQTQDNWQTKLPITIGGVTYNGGAGSTNWIGTPKGKGMCRVSYEKDRGVIFNWEGGYAGDASLAVKGFLKDIGTASNKDTNQAYYSNQDLRIGTKTVKVRIYYADSLEFKKLLIRGSYSHVHMIRAHFMKLRIERMGQIPQMVSHIIL